MCIRDSINKDPLKIAIIGEIYTVIEPYSNFYIEDKLMDYGVSSKRGLTPSWWFKNMILCPARINSLNIKKASRKYLPLEIGGHAKECIGEAILSYREGFDGAIPVSYTHLDVYKRQRQYHQRLLLCPPS